jgi:hypothetical protein
MALSDELRVCVDDFLAGTTGVAPLAVWTQQHTREVNSSRDAEAKELLANVRRTIDALLHGRVENEVGARQQLTELIASAKRGGWNERSTLD